MINKTKIRELSSYLKIPEREINKAYKNIDKSPSAVLWVKNTNKDWDAAKINQSKRKEVENWFKKNKSYIFELSENYSLSPKKKLTQFVVKFCKKNKIKSLLDFGGGIGDDAISASKAKIDTTLADLPSTTLDFAKWRIKKHKAKVKIIEVKNDFPLTSNYEAIICFEVFQHLFNPLKVARHLKNHLEKDGYLLATFHFKNPTYHMTLKKNYHLQSTFQNELKKIGLVEKEKLYLWGKGTKTKYLYIYQK